MNRDRHAMRDYAGKVVALSVDELAVWRTSSAPAPAPVRETGEQRWEGEGGRVHHPAPARQARR